ncbi:MAG: hypothetical protein QOJ99_5834 [Bryobacterales bacterium]|nr:hypothetical protein [Bryobacterales bacterium]
MTLTEKLEQRFTGRPAFYVAARTLNRLLGKPADRQEMPVGYNLAMHWGQGILPGAVRGLMAKKGVRGPFRSFLLCTLRLLNDQTLENASGVGAPPWTWLVNEQVLDLVRKGVYAIVTGMVAARLLRGPRAARGPSAVHKL